MRSTDMTVIHFGFDAKLLYLCVVLRIMKGYTIFRLLCLTALWLLLCYLMIAGRGFNAWTLFIIIVSGGVVFIPLYKKYIRDVKGKY